MIEDIDLTLKPVQAQMDAETHTLIPQASNLLREDDRILELLESCVGEDENIDTAAVYEEENSRVLKRVDKLTRLLKHFTEEAVHGKLDRVFLESAMSPAQHANESGAGGGDSSVSPTDEHKEDPTSITQEVEGVEGEMASLCPDIGALVDMTVEHEYGNPIPSAIRGEVREQQQRVARGVHLVCL